MHTDVPDERLSKYDLIRPLGSGGMGVVYLARDTRLNRQVAIKFVSPERLADPGAEQRLLREARAAAALDHPSICPVYDVHVDPQGRTCIVMQYVEGEILSQRLARGPLAGAAAAALAAEIADALSVAHARGIVHRDLKPGNIILTPSGRPKLLDFGIAHVELPPEAIANALTHTSTDSLPSGLVVGTPAYMSPEQILRQPADGRSDLFSLGAVLFECFTGQPAFQAATDVETWSRVVYADLPAVSSLVPGLSATDDAVCARLLAKKPADRFQSADEAAAALRGLLPGAHASPRPHRDGRVWVRAGVAALAVGTVALGGWRYAASRPLPPAPAEARQWFERGTEQLRAGAAFSAKQALTEAIRLHPQYSQALARLAEAEGQLDEDADAQNAIVRAFAVAGDPRRLVREDASRLAAIRASLLRDFAAASRLYQGIADAHAGDQGAWLDLGRAQQAAGDQAAARVSYERALQIDRQYAAAHLRLGGLTAQEAHRQEALGEFREAERLYRAASDYEGLTESLLQRARFLNGLAAFTDAREALDAASTIASQTGNAYQQIRAELLASSLTASAGAFDESQRLAQHAVTSAMQGGLVTVAASGLIDLGTALMQGDKPEDARRQLEQAVALAKSRGAGRLTARGTLQLASWYLARQQPTDARNLAQGLLDYLRWAHLKRYELLALSISARADEDLGEYAQAGIISRQVLTMAEELGDQSEVGVTLENLAGQSAAVGDLPGALAFRERLEALHRRLGDTASLAYDLTNRAELLIRLGRPAAAEAPLHEVEVGVAAGVDVFQGRVRRVTLLRALAAAYSQRYAEAEVRCREVIERSSALNVPDDTRRLAGAVSAYARARLGRPFTDRGEIASANESGSALFRRELAYWRAATWLARDDNHAALATAVAGLSDEPASSPEIDWQLAAVAAVAARRLHDDQADLMAARARRDLAQLRELWQGDIADYEKRADAIGRRREAGLS